jgi:Na+/H+ antiporter NhaC
VKSSPEPNEGEGRDEQRLFRGEGKDIIIERRIIRSLIITKSLVLSFFLIVISILLMKSSAHCENAKRYTVIKEVPFDYQTTGLINPADIPEGDSVSILLDGNTVFEGTTAELTREKSTISLRTGGNHKLTLIHRGGTQSMQLHAIDGILSILPPVVAIVFALIFRQVVVALLSGIWLGSFFLTGFSPLQSVLRIVDTYVIESLAGTEAGTDHVSIIIFTLLLGGMVGITSRMGGMQGVVDRLSRLATTAKRGQLAVWLMGIIIFFDDYTNTLIVGNSTRPLTDRLKISREKLAYIVDSTAAPVTSLAVITSWIGFEISLINQSYVSMGLDRNPLATFVSSIPYSFYPILALLFVLFIILSDRDYSSMLKAESRARQTGRLSSETAQPLSNLDSESIQKSEKAEPRLINGVIPITVVIAVTFIGLIQTGKSSLAEEGILSPPFFEILKSSDSFRALLWGSFSGCITAAVLAISQKLLTLTETITSWINGIKSMMPAMIILVLAWGIGKICSELHTAGYLVHNLGNVLSPGFLPVLIFLLAMGIAFSTGTSWGTMSILIPIVIPLVFGTVECAGINADNVNSILYPSIAAILSGAVFGDHCSPISDTTIMSSMASAADHVDHVRTQLPYALTVGATSLVSGYLLTSVGFHPAASLALGVIILIAVIRILGKSPESVDISQ